VSDCMKEMTTQMKTKKTTGKKKPVSRKQHKIDQFAALLEVRTKTLTTTEVRKQLLIGEKTYMEDTWLYKYKAIVRLDRGVWLINKPR
jgi:glucan biosynthesis protein